jgi:hypothetical protein
MEVAKSIAITGPCTTCNHCPNNFDRDQVHGQAFLTSCELYILLAASDLLDEQVHIHWALSYLKSGHAATFTKHIVRQEMKIGKICFASWGDFTVTFTSMFCPENEATMVLMWLESKRYFQGRQNIEAYIDEFKDLINLSGYTDPITIVFKFH